MPSSASFMPDFVRLRASISRSASDREKSDGTSKSPQRSNPWADITGQTMHRKGAEASERQHKSVVILSERSREIIRLFEERQRKRQRLEQSRRAHSFSQLRTKS
jgi:hypothetical protein